MSIWAGSAPLSRSRAGGRRGQRRSTSLRVIGPTQRPANSSASGWAANRSLVVQHVPRIAQVRVRGGPPAFATRVTSRTSVPGRNPAEARLPSFESSRSAVRKSGNGPPDGKQSASLRTIGPDTLTEAGSPIGHHRRPASTPRTLIVRRLISLGSLEGTLRRGRGAAPGLRTSAPPFSQFAPVGAVTPCGCFSGCRCYQPSTSRGSRPF